MYVLSVTEAMQLLSFNDVVLSCFCSA